MASSQTEGLLGIMIPCSSEQCGEGGRPGRELGKWVRELFHSRRIQWRPVKGLAPNSEAAGLQSFLVSENCLNIKSTDKAKWGLCSNIDIWGLEDCKRKEGNKNGYTLRVSLFYWKRPSKVQRRRKISKRFFFKYSFQYLLNTNKHQ